MAGLTQAALARLAGVSQSLIAKVEAGKSTPSYEKAKRIFDALEESASQEALCAEDLMTKKVVAVEKTATVRQAVKAMEARGISQVPVLDKGQSVGLISEKTVLARLGGHPEKVWDTCRVASVMEESLPLIAPHTPLTLLANMLQHYPALLVARKGRIVGILTKSDLLTRLLQKKPA